MTPVILLALALSALCSDIPVEGGVYVLSDETFKTFVGENPYVLAEFYAPWCGHCKKLDPEYSAAAEKLKGTNIKLAKVDATQNKAISEEFKVQGYPTLQFFVDGKGSEYDGPREAEGIVSWLKKKTQPPADLKTVKELKDLTKSEELLVLGVFQDLKSEKALEFLAASKKIDATVATSTSSEVRKHLKLSEGDEVLLLKQYDNLRDELGSSWTADDLPAKVSTLGRRLVTPFTEKYQKSIFVPENKKIAFAVIDHQDKSESAKELACITEAAKKFRNVVFVDVDSSDSGASRVLDYFGLSASSKGALVVFEPEGSAKYKFTGGNLCDGLESFVQDYLDGKVERFLKKQKTPEDWDAEHVKVLTGYNFHEIALDTNKHVFVEFYAPWCGHCKQLEPVWNKLGKYFRKRDDIVIAKVDATLNEIAEVPVESFPTLKFFPKGSTTILDYSGERNYKALKKYVVSHAGPNPKKKKA